MIRVDENDPVDEVQLSFPPRDVQIKKGIDPKKQYDLLNEIGRGKFGTVYKCIENSTGLALAAKFISCPKKEDRKNVEQEIDIMRSLQHPRLIQLYDAFENNKVMCVVLELIEGGELFERVIDDDFVLTEKSCTVFMRQICEGVDFIHKQRILHLDMKPENILCLTRTGNRIKIIDFGLARRFDPNKKLQVLFGTPEFVAPEVVNFDQIGYGTDLWSVGVICYVLLSGLSPFMGATDVETMANVTIAKYDFDDEAFQEISENAKDFIRRLLVKDINQRMSTQDCLNHEWLLKKKTCRSYSMDVTKDNLKQFVERWNEHPNSPYMFETTSHLITDSHQLSGSLYSLVGMSPSPCGSLASSSDHDNDYLTTETKDNYSNLDYLRRSSDSTCIMKGPDVYERINLAEEIRKLTNRLFQISNITTSFTNNNQLLSSSESLKINHFNNDTNDSINNTNCETKLLKELPKDHPQSPICGVPWRKGKNRLNNMSRDVPLPLKTDMKQTQNETESTSRRQSLNSNPTKTKDLLLRLLEQWDGPRNPIRPNTRHKSISTEWNENDSLGQRTISSLNNFFHSRNKTKKTTNFHTQN